MSDLILHHFDASPFAEKIRLVLGLKSLDWRSVQIPMVMPKPDLTALTGGYRKTPVLQIGAEIYCDTRRIALELERRHPEPSIFADGNPGMALALGYWSDSAFFPPGAALSMGVNTEIPDAVLTDRAAFFDFMDFDTLAEDVPHFYTQLTAHAGLIDKQLEDGRDFLFGTRPGWGDVCAYFVVWMVRHNVAPAAEHLAFFERMAEWESRMQAIGHGHSTEFDATAALEIARDSTPEEGEGVTESRTSLSAGQTVTVTPTDYGKVSVVGALITLNHREIVVRRSDSRAGEVNVYFPRAGYRVAAALR